MLLTVGNTKGGVGKSTLAVNIAVARALAGRDVLLVDGDEQGTASDFTQIRSDQLGAPGYTAVRLSANAIQTQVSLLAPRYGDVVIDVGGRDTISLRAALVVSDVLLAPVLPRSFDMWALDQIAELVKLARVYNPKLRALVVLNAADPQGHDNEEAAEIARQVEGLQVLDTMIGRRKAFSNAGAFGRSVLDYTPQDAKAIDELQALLSAVYGTL